MLAIVKLNMSICSYFTLIFVCYNYLGLSSLSDQCKASNSNSNIMIDNCSSREVSIKYNVLILNFIFSFYHCFNMRVDNGYDNLLLNYQLMVLLNYLLLQYYHCFNMRVDNGYDNLLLNYQLMVLLNYLLLQY